MSDKATDQATPQNPAIPQDPAAAHVEPLASLPQSYLDGLSNEEAMTVLRNSDSYQKALDDLNSSLGSASVPETPNEQQAGTQSGSADPNPAADPNPPADPNDNPWGVNPMLMRDGKILGKFNSPDELARGYGELQSAFGSKKRSEDFFKANPTLFGKPGEKAEAQNATLPPERTEVTEESVRAETPAGTPQTTDRQSATQPPAATEEREYFDQQDQFSYMTATEKTTLDKWITESMKTQFEKQFADRGYEWPEKEEDIEAIRMADPYLAMQLESSARQYMTDGLRVIRNSHASEHDRMMIERMEPDVTRTLIENEVDGIKSRTGWSNEDAIRQRVGELLDMPDNDQFYETRGGVRMLRPGAVTTYITLTENQSILDHVRQSAQSSGSQQASEFYANRLKSAGPLPNAMVPHTDGAAHQSAQYVIPSPEQWKSPRFADDHTPEELDAISRAIDKMTREMQIQYGRQFNS